MGELINASPTKKLVAYVLTKDIVLEHAVLDLIDNSIDGARRLSPENFNGFEVTVNFSQDSFSIEDNCGGIPYEIAKDYAFRFGRPDDYIPLEGPSDLIGNFGVGMKRALLKMGKKINIYSTTPERYFEIEIEVEKWLEDDKNWNFEFSNVIDFASPAQKTGTRILVTDLYQGIAEKFALKQFKDALKLQIKEKQATPLLQGISIIVGDDHIAGSVMQLMLSKDIKPFYKFFRLEFPEGPVTVSIYAGLADSDNNRAGWYVICNGRTLLQADTSSVTGWGNKYDGDRIPSYHNQYARFRGYVIFHSDSPRALPWNTTKSGVDMEHPAYRKSSQEMILAMRQVFSFLNALDRESDSEQQPLTSLLKKLKAVPLSDLGLNDSFVFPKDKTKVSESRKLRWVRYQKPVEQVHKVMEYLEVDRPEEAGEKTFDIYYSLNIE